ncbi:hypothetical protein FACS1894201_09010 [Bacteroidia bacterium]|nr:hypothetical protein FACS1894201_09010 [Bacteroidia bacterium]
MGNVTEGMGVVQPEELTSQTVPVNATPIEAEDDPVITENNDAINLEKPKTKPVQPREVKPTPQPEVRPTEEPQKPQLNPNALYSRNAKAGGSEGTGQVQGDQGDVRGTPNGTAYTGEPGNGGINFSLHGREAKTLAKPTYNSEDQGVVVVKIWVNNTGNVVRVQAGEQGTTTSDNNLWRASESAAMKSKFSVKEDAPSQQIGYITYRFIKLN